jgi:hypothetical protein
LLIPLPLLNPAAAAAAAAGKVTKPVVAWVSGTCAKLFKSEVQFGHAGARSTGESDSAQVGCSLGYCVCWCTATEPLLRLGIVGVGLWVCIVCHVFQK